MISPPCLLRTRSTIWGRQPSGRGLMPPTPWMHSKINPETLPAVLALRVSLASATNSAGVRWLPLQVLGQANFSNSKPPLIPEFQVPTLVMLPALPTNPWQPLRSERNLYSLVKSRARQTAKSLASPPELQRQTLSQPSPNSWQSLLEYSACHSERQMGEVCVNLATCQLTTLVIAGWECPRATVEIPEMRSMYLLPWWSKRYWRCPSVMRSGFLQQWKQKLGMQVERSLRICSQGRPEQGWGWKEHSGSLSEENRDSVTRRIMVGSNYYEKGLSSTRLINKKQQPNISRGCMGRWMGWGGIAQGNGWVMGLGVGVFMERDQEFVNQMLLLVRRQEASIISAPSHQLSAQVNSEKDSGLKQTADMIIQVNQYSNHSCLIQPIILTKFIDISPPSLIAQPSLHILLLACKSFLILILINMINQDSLPPNQKKSIRSSTWFSLSSHIKDASTKMKPQSSMVIGELIGICMGVFISSLFNRIQDPKNNVLYMILLIYVAWKFVVLLPCLFFPDQKTIAKNSFWLQVAIISSVFYCFRKMKELAIKLVIFFLRWLKRVIEFILAKMTKHLEKSSARKDVQKKAEQAEDQYEKLKTNKK